MNPSVEDLIRRAKQPETSAGYVSVPLSDWHSMIWLLDNMQGWEARLDAAGAVVEAARKHAEGTGPHYAVVDALAVFDGLARSGEQT